MPVNSLPKMFRAVTRLHSGQQFSFIGVLQMMECVWLTGIGVLCSAFALAEGLLRSATLLHTSILKSGLRAPMSFFDSTPTGRIMNRFSKDIDVVDSQLPRSLHSWVVCALSVMATIAVICYSTPIFLVVVLPMSVIYYLVQVQPSLFPTCLFVSQSGMCN